MASEDLLKKAVAAFNALSPEQQAEMLEDQRQSWVRGNIGLSRDERGMTSPVMPRPAPAATDTGLETAKVEHRVHFGEDGNPTEWREGYGMGLYPQEPIVRVEVREYVTRSQAEAIIAAKNATLQDAIECVKVLTEEKNKLEADNAALVHDLNRIKDHETELVNDNAAKAARINGFEGFLDDLAEILGCERDIGDVVNELDAINNRAEALEAKLAAAQEAHKSLFGDKTMEDILWPDVKPTDLITIRVQKQIYDKARAVLGGKPS